MVAHGKYIFRKCFSVLTCLWCKMISVFILPSNTIFWKTERERVCVSEIEPARKERERERGEEKRPHCRQPMSFDFAGDPETLRHEPRSPFDFDFESHPDRTLWLRWRTQRPGSHAFDFAPFDFVEMALRQHRSHWVRDWEMVGFWWIWPSLINFFWLGFDEFDRIWWIFFGWVLMNLIGSMFIYWEIVLYICLGAEKMWENVRNNKKMCFLYYFQQHNQTRENIFQSICWNATKYLKMFSFPKNIYFPENILHKPNTA